MAACPRVRRAVWGVVSLGLLTVVMAGCGARTSAPTRAATLPPPPAATVAPAPVHAVAAATARARRARRAAAAIRARAAASGAGATRSRAVAPAHPVPVAFRIANGAPSDAQVRDELRQMYQVQHAAQHAALSAAAANLAGLLPWTQEVKTNRVSVASVFRDYGLGLACGGLLGRQQIGVAHKTAPCGTIVAFSYAGRTLEVPVIDRGPFIAGREWDLTGATAQALGFPGLGQISWSVVSQPGSGATR